MENKKINRCCSVENCINKHDAKGFCPKHYTRFKRHGSPLILIEKHELHGMYTTSEYSSWKNMKARCNNKNSAEYFRYGGSGVEVCEEWLNSFSAFYKDMGDRPIGLTLERIDSNGNYSPENCTWADRVTQARNRKQPAVKLLDSNERSKIKLRYLKGESAPSIGKDLGLSSSTISIYVKHNLDYEKYPYDILL